MSAKHQEEISLLPDKVRHSSSEISPPKPIKQTPWPLALLANFLFPPIVSWYAAKGKSKKFEEQIYLGARNGSLIGFFIGLAVVAALILVSLYTPGLLGAFKLLTLTYTLAFSIAIPWLFSIIGRGVGFGFGVRQILPGDATNGVFFSAVLFSLVGDVFEKRFYGHFLPELNEDKIHCLDGMNALGLLKKESRRENLTLIYSTHVPTDSMVNCFNLLHQTDFRFDESTFQRVFAPEPFKCIPAIIQQMQVYHLLNRANVGLLLDGIVALRGVNDIFNDLPGKPNHLPEEVEEKREIPCNFSSASIDGFMEKNFHDILRCGVNVFTAYKALRLLSEANLLNDTTKAAVIKNPQRATHFAKTYIELHRWDPIIAEENFALLAENSPKLSFGSGGGLLSAFMTLKGRGREEKHYKKLILENSTQANSLANFFASLGDVGIVLDESCMQSITIIGNLSSLSDYLIKLYNAGVFGICFPLILKYGAGAYDLAGGFLALQRANILEEPYISLLARSANGYAWELAYSFVILHRAGILKEPYISYLVTRRKHDIGILASSFAILHEANILDEQFQTLIRQDPGRFAVELAKAFIELNKAGILQDSYLTLLAEHHDRADTLACSFVALHQAGIFDEYSDVIIENKVFTIYKPTGREFKDSREIASALVTLKQKGLLTPANRPSIIQFIRYVPELTELELTGTPADEKQIGQSGCELSLVFAYLKESERGCGGRTDRFTYYDEGRGQFIKNINTLNRLGILSRCQGALFEGIAFAPNLSAAIITLHEAKMLTPENWRIVFENQRIKNTAKLLVKLEEANLLNNALYRRLLRDTLSMRLIGSPEYSPEIVLSMVMVFEELEKVGLLEPNASKSQAGQNLKVALGLDKVDFSSSVSEVLQAVAMLRWRYEKIERPMQTQEQIQQHIQKHFSLLLSHQKRGYAVAKMLLMLKEMDDEITSFSGFPAGAICTAENIGLIYYKGWPYAKDIMGVFDFIKGQRGSFFDGRGRLTRAGIPKIVQTILQNPGYAKDMPAIITGSNWDIPTFEKMSADLFQQKPPTPPPYNKPGDEVYEFRDAIDHRSIVQGKTISQEGEEKRIEGGALRFFKSTSRHPFADNRVLDLVEASLRKNLFPHPKPLPIEQFHAINQAAEQAAERRGQCADMMRV